MNMSMLSRSLLTIVKMNGSTPAPSSLPPAEETVAEERSLGSYTHMKNKELYPQRERVVDEGCSEDLESFPLLSGESVEYLGSSGDDHLVITNFRFFATQEAGVYNVPLGLIESAVVSGSKEELLILCRDARSFRYVFESPLRCKLWQERLVQAINRRRRNITSAFAFVHRAYHRDEKLERMEEDGRGEEEEMGVASGEGVLLSLSVPELRDWVTPEYRRMGMDLANTWRITDCNAKYKVCPTYPKLFVVPRYVSDSELAEAAKFRMSNRIPVVVWRHTNGSVIVRSSQPLVGVLGWRNTEDEGLLLAISQACLPAHPSPSPPPPTYSELPYSNGGPPAQLMEERGDRRESLANGNAHVTGTKPHLENGHTPSAPHRVATPPVLLILDLRSYTAALGNRAKGGGCECQEYYPNCEIQYKGLPNIHSVRKSFQQLRIIVTSEDQAGFLSNLEGSQWLSFLSQLLSAACDVVAAVHCRSQPVLVHCSDGWDRTTQVVALAELMLDSYYRTIEGFQILVEREWLAYGHKFCDRCGHHPEDPNECSPVLIQWLDCVHQLIRQFPCDFEFNEAFLIKLGQHCHSGLFGTFLGNCVREREEGRVAEETFPVWSLLHSGNKDFVNHLYRGQQSQGGSVSQIQVLRPVTHIRNMLLWKAMYCTCLLMPYQPASHQQRRVSSPSRRGGTVDGERNAKAGTSTPVVAPERTVAPSPALSEDPTNIDPKSPSPVHSVGSSGPSPLDCTASGCHTPTDSTSSSPQHHSRPIDSVSLSTVPGSSALDTSLLKDAMSDETDAVRELTDSNSTVCYGGASRAGSQDVGPDSLPRVLDPVQQRLSELAVQHEETFYELKTKLREARRTVRMLRERQRSEGEGVREGTMEGGEGSSQEGLDTQDELPSSQNSWVCVDSSDSQGVMWVPDHAANNCQKCGETFSAVVTRKHHCRSCGGVFCGTCANFYCPVPKEQLFDDVRVCERCFYKLDGHLRGKAGPSYPT